MIYSCYLIGCALKGQQQQGQSWNHLNFERSARTWYRGVRKSKGKCGTALPTGKQCEHVKAMNLKLSCSIIFYVVTTLCGINMNLLCSFLKYNLSWLFKEEQMVSQQSSDCCGWSYLLISVLNKRREIKQDNTVHYEWNHNMAIFTFSSLSCPVIIYFAYLPSVATDTLKK